jgi:hypothetical protein
LSHDYVTRALGADDELLYAAFVTTPSYMYKLYQ